MKLRTLWLLSTLFLVTSSADAQYQPTALEGANWIIYKQVETADQGYVDHHIFRIKGDTIIKRSL